MPIPMLLGECFAVQNVTDRWLMDRGSTSKVKKVKKKEKPKLSFEEDEEENGEDGARGAKRSRSPSTGKSRPVWGAWTAT
jgi:hypothetical protein